MQVITTAQQKIYGFFVRWVFSTNHKDIGTLYFIFATISGLAGTMLSIYIRATLSQPNSNYLSMNYHLYNGAPSNKYLRQHIKYVSATTSRIESILY